MNKHGTYRIVKYADDGQYDIHWTCCDSHMQSCKWQAERFSFCPFCGAGHATKLECRESSTARWAYDLHSDDEHKAASVSYDADVKAHNLKKNQTRWIIEREGRRNTGSWFATHRVHYLHASDALKAADRLFAKKREEEPSEYHINNPIVLRLRLVTGDEDKEFHSTKVLESPRWVHDPVGDYAKEHGLSRRDAQDKIIIERVEKTMNEMEDEYE